MKRLTTVLLLSLIIVSSEITITAQVVTDLAARAKRPSPYPEAEPQVIKEGVLGISEADIEPHQTLLSQPNTGLMRLLPRESNDWAVYKVEKKLEMRGGGAYFSFYFRAHPYGYGSDIGFEQGKLHIGSAGMMTDIGNVEIEGFDVSDPRTSYLLTYQPPTKDSAVHEEHLKFYPNFSVDGVAYMKYIRSDVNHTYLVRSIVYDRYDILAVFKIVKKDDDGSLIIAWKLLKEFPAPKREMDQPAVKTTP